MNFAGCRCSDGTSTASWQARAGLSADGRRLVHGQAHGDKILDLRFLAGLAKDASAMPAARWRAILDEIRRAGLTTAAQGVRTQTLIIAGACDPLFGDEHQQALSRCLAEASIVRAEACGHNPHWEDPAFVARTITGAFET